MKFHSWGRALALVITLLSSACMTHDTRPTKESMVGVQIPNLSVDEVTFELVDRRAIRQASEIVTAIVKRDLASVLSPTPADGVERRYKFIVEINEFKSYFSAPQWHSIISLRVKMLSPDAELIGIVEPAAHAYRFNTWGYGSAEDAEREARRATASEFVRLATPLLNKTSEARE